MLGADAKELVQKCTEPGVIVVYMVTEVSAGASECKQRGRGKVRGDMGERFLGEVEEKRAMLMFL